MNATLRSLEGGHRNCILASDDWVFKTTRRSEQAIEWLNPVHDRAEAAGVVVPRLQRSLNGRYVEDGWTVEPFMAGNPLPEAELGQLSEPVKKFHRLCVDIPQRPEFLSADRLSRAAGDVNLGKMPKDLARECLRSWRALNGLPQSVVHGDLNPSNILRGAKDELILLDWDETRVDTCAFDTVQIAGRSGLSPAILRAIDAWEIACSWSIEPEYAQRLADVFMQSAPST